MNLREALRKLASVHTRDDVNVGFTIESTARPGDFVVECTVAEYTEAWRVVRKYLYLPTAPKEY